MRCSTPPIIACGAAGCADSGRAWRPLSGSAPTEREIVQAFSRSRQANLPDREKRGSFRTRDILRAAEETCAVGNGHLFEIELSYFITHIVSLQSLDDVKQIQELRQAVLPTKEDSCPPALSRTTGCGPASGK